MPTCIGPKTKNESTKPITSPMSDPSRAISSSAPSISGEISRPVLVPGAEPDDELLTNELPLETMPVMRL